MRHVRDAAETANRAKSAFLANMSHEIRTPRNAIIGLSHLLRREAIQPRQREQLGKVGDAADHLLQVINDVLDLSKIEAGRHELDQVDLSPAALVVSCRSQVATEAHRKGLDLSIEMDDGPDALRGDPTRLSQVLLHHAGARVLPAEDNAANQEVALALMESVGLQVDVAVNGLEAVEEARTGGLHSS
jgi:signal transduction histidine kinase